MFYMKENFKFTTIHAHFRHSFHLLDILKFKIIVSALNIPIISKSTSDELVKEVAYSFKGAVEVCSKTKLERQKVWSTFRWNIVVLTSWREHDELFRCTTPQGMKDDREDWQRISGSRRRLGSDHWKLVNPLRA